MHSSSFPSPFHANYIQANYIQACRLYIVESWTLATVWFDSRCALSSSYMTTAYFPDFVINTNLDPRKELQPPGASQPRIAQT